MWHSVIVFCFGDGLGHDDTRTTHSSLCTWFVLFSLSASVALCLYILLFGQVESEEPWRGSLFSEILRFSCKSIIPSNELYTTC